MNNVGVKWHEIWNVKCTVKYYNEGEKGSKYDKNLDDNLM